MLLSGSDSSSAAFSSSFVHPRLALPMMFTEASPSPVSIVDIHMMQFTYFGCCFCADDASETIYSLEFTLAACSCIQFNRD